MKTAGVDIGSLTGKALILEDHNIMSWSLIPTNPDPNVTVKKAIDIALEKAHLSNVKVPGHEGLWPFNVLVNHEIAIALKLTPSSGYSAATNSAEPSSSPSRIVLVSP